MEDQFLGAGAFLSLYEVLLRMVELYVDVERCLQISRPFI